MLTSSQIHERLKSRFGAAVLEFVEEPHGPYVRVDPLALLRIAEYLKSDPELAFNYLASLSAVDEKENLAAVYHLETVDLLSGRTVQTLILKVVVPRGAPVIASVAPVWGTADWQERECFDLMGLEFSGHPDLKRILTEDDWVGHPLRKDYVFPKEYRGIDLT